MKITRENFTIEHQVFGETNRFDVYFLGEKFFTFSTQVDAQDFIYAVLAYEDLKPKKELSFARPVLAQGEIYVGCLGDQEGNRHHVIMLPWDDKFSSWNRAMECASIIGASIPNRIEQAMLFAHFPHEFKKDWYWSCEEHSSEPARAWCQSFTYGYQDYYRKSTELRARAVRRVPVEATV